MPRDDEKIADFEEAAERLKATRAKADADDHPAELSDDALALRFADRLGADLRYVDTWGRWQRWAGAEWRIDDTLAVFDEARTTCRAAADGRKRKISAAVTSAKTIAAVERLARSDRRIAATAEQWDANPDLFNTPWSTP